MSPSQRAGTATGPTSPKTPPEIAPGVDAGGWNDAVRFEGVRCCVLDEAPEGMPSATHIPIYHGEADAVDRKNLGRPAESVRRARAEGQPVPIIPGISWSRGRAWNEERRVAVSLLRSAEVGEEPRKTSRRLSHHSQRRLSRNSTDTSRYGQG